MSVIESAFSNLRPVVEGKDFYWEGEHESGVSGLIFRPKFEAYGKTPRLNREISISEKLDGTNVGVIIDAHGGVWPQSRNRMIAPGKGADHYGFARWVIDNADVLRDTLGVGRHFGEWVGPKIGPRDYGLTENHLYLFNPRHAEAVKASGLARLHIVPQLGSWGSFDSAMINGVLTALIVSGSQIAPEGKYVKPEGVIVYHSASGQSFKVLVDSDELPKGLIV